MRDVPTQTKLFHARTLRYSAAVRVSTLSSVRRRFISTTACSRGYRDATAICMWKQRRIERVDKCSHITRYLCKDDVVKRVLRDAGARKARCNRCLQASREQLRLKIEKVANAAVLTRTSLAKMEGDARCSGVGATTGRYVTCMHV